MQSAGFYFAASTAFCIYIARQPGVVSKKRAVAPVVLKHLQVSDSLTRDLDRLGLERKATPIPSLAEYLAAHHDADSARARGGTLSTHMNNLPNLTSERKSVESIREKAPESWSGCPKKPDQHPTTSDQGVALERLNAARSDSPPDEEPR
jgi:hypothetical protein